MTGLPPGKGRRRHDRRIFIPGPHLSDRGHCLRPHRQAPGHGVGPGHLLAGIVIGPYALGFIGREGQNIMHFAEFGVVMMLFLIGLELEPSHFWGMRHRILGMGSAQIIVTSLVLCAGMMLLNFNWKTALASSLALAMSSTAIVLQSMKEKGLGDT